MKFTIGASHSYACKLKKANGKSAMILNTASHWGHAFIHWPLTISIYYQNRGFGEELKYLVSWSLGVTRISPHDKKKDPREWA